MKAEEQITVGSEGNMDYFTMQAVQGVKEIHKVSEASGPTKELSELAQNNLRSLDAELRGWNLHYRQNPHDGRISDALIRTQQMKKTIVDNMLEKIGKAEK